MLNKLIKYGLPGLAAGLAIFALIHSYIVQRSEPQANPPVEPSSSPFGNTVAGAGMVEGNTEASGTSIISIGSQMAGAIVQVHVQLGQQVKSGDLLFELDSRLLEAQVKTAQATLAASKAQLRKLELEPRPEEVPPAIAQMDAAEASVKSTKDTMERDKNISGGAALAAQQRVIDRQAYMNALALFSVAKANLALLKAGTWEPDKIIAKTNVDLSQAQLDQARTNLLLLQVRAPIDGTILQLNVRAGEYVSTMANQALILMGNLKPLNIRVSIDEEDLPRLILNSPATAKIRGDSNQKGLPLKFIRLEPYIVPKVSLTGVNTERVDTRVVQVIYAVIADEKTIKESKLLVGQIVDVFIDLQEAKKP
ncbi:biotin/lipoyl-binding protein [Telmatocola sphagniphila]|uniref:Biotin/lipoyl-binding protein n=1 Tax=Telmatocola sphagniphila TaxID=1123043 RepID=A0A8E6BA23_9BACT|nr:biotin/lipoyl-binding protein [Telmatocola sphagniphila]QVL34044.1 biotin/lipoyl-binding protein [Telmatocola sphagniphila]